MAKPEKNCLPSSKLFIDMSSSKDAPAQNAFSPPLRRTITFTKELFPAFVIAVARPLNNSPGKELL